MPSVFAKLNLKDQRDIVVLNAPPSFEPELASLRDVTIRRDLGAVPTVNFSIAFVTKQQELDALSPSIATKAEGDAIVWFAYPKGSSKNYRSEIKRDAGWSALRAAGFEPVRMVAIDADWTALRFRRVDYIKVLTRRVDNPRALPRTGGKRKR